MPGDFPLFPKARTCIGIPGPGNPPWWRPSASSPARDRPRGLQWLAFSGGDRANFETNIPLPPGGHCCRPEHAPEPPGCRVPPPTASHRCNAHLPLVRRSFRRSLLPHSQRPLVRCANPARSTVGRKERCQSSRSRRGRRKSGFPRGSSR